MRSTRSLRRMKEQEEMELKKRNKAKVPTWRPRKEELKSRYVKDMMMM